MDVEQVKEDVLAGRITIDRLIEVVVTSQRALQATKEEAAALPPASKKAGKPSASPGRPVAVPAPRSAASLRRVPASPGTPAGKTRSVRTAWAMEIISVAKGTDQSHGHHFDHPDPKKVVDFIVRHTTPAPAQPEGKEPSPTPTP